MVYFQSAMDSQVVRCLKMEVSMMETILTILPTYFIIKPIHWVGICTASHTSLRVNILVCVLNGRSGFNPSLVKFQVEYTKDMFRLNIHQIVDRNVVIALYANHRETYIRGCNAAVRSKPKSSIL